MTRIVDLSHTLAHDLETYKGLPPVHVCDFLSREESRALYGDQTEFQINTVTLCGNSGTYIDSPFHRFADGEDLADMPLDRTVNLPGIVIRQPVATNWQAVDCEAFRGHDLRGKAVLIDTGWSRHFGQKSYQENHPYVTEAAAELLRDQGAALVGIDSHNIDDTRSTLRPVHTILLGAGIPIVEHLTNLSALPDLSFRFFAAPLKFRGVGTFPTRPYALLRPSGT